MAGVREPAPFQVGGVATATLGLVKVLLNQGIEVTLVVPFATSGSSPVPDLRIVSVTCDAYSAVTPYAVLRRLIALNPSLPLSIDGFKAGRQIIFPTEEDIQQGFHVIDRDAAQLGDGPPQRRRARRCRLVRNAVALALADL